MSTLGERLEGLVAKWQVEHSEALSQAKGETDDQAYIGWMRLAAVTRNHMIELEAALRAEGQGELTEERAQNLARSYLYGAMGYLGISELKDEAVKDVASRLRADFAAAAPSLHKEGAGDARHGYDCVKVMHTRDGYLHDALDDGPYDVDGWMYCGRCHMALDTPRETDK